MPKVKTVSMCRFCNMILSSREALKRHYVTVHQHWLDVNSWNPRKLTDAEYDQKKKMYKHSARHVYIKKVIQQKIAQNDDEVEAYHRAFETATPIQRRFPTLIKLPDPVPQVGPRTTPGGSMVSAFPNRYLGPVNRSKPGPAITAARKQYFRGTSGVVGGIPLSLLEEETSTSLKNVVRKRKSVVATPVPTLLTRNVAARAEDEDFPVLDVPCHTGYQSVTSGEDTGRSGYPMVQTEDTGRSGYPMVQEEDDNDPVRSRDLRADLLERHRILRDIRALDQEEVDQEEQGYQGGRVGLEVEGGVNVSLSAPRRKLPYGDTLPWTRASYVSLDRCLSPSILPKSKPCATVTLADLGEEPLSSPMGPPVSPPERQVLEQAAGGVTVTVQGQTPEGQGGSSAGIVGVAAEDQGCEPSSSRGVGRRQRTLLCSGANRLSGVAARSSLSVKRRVPTLSSGCEPSSSRGLGRRQRTLLRSRVNRPSGVTSRPSLPVKRRAPVPALKNVKKRKMSRSTDTVDLTPVRRTPTVLYRDGSCQTDVSFIPDVKVAYKVVEPVEERGELLMSVEEIQIIASGSDSEL